MSIERERTILREPRGEKVVTVPNGSGRPLSRHDSHHGRGLFARSVLIVGATGVTIGHGNAFVGPITEIPAEPGKYLVGGLLEDALGQVTEVEVVRVR